MIEQRTEEWHKQRSGRITASLVGAILGLSPFMSRKEAFKVFMGESKFKGNSATEWGNFNEAGAIKQFEMESGLSVSPAPFVPYGERFGASPDGYVSDGYLIECKCPYGLRNGGEFKSINEQPQYYAQIQLQLLCTCKTKCYFYQWSPFGSMCEIVIRDNDYIEDMIAKLNAFWDEAHSIKTTSDNDDLINEYFKNKDTIEKITLRQKEIIEILATKTNGFETKEHKLYKVKKEGAISYSKAFNKLMPEVDLSEFRGESVEYWVLK